MCARRDEKIQARDPGDFTNFCDADWTIPLVRGISHL